MGMLMILPIRFVRVVMQHALYVLLIASPLVRNATADGSWLPQNASNVMTLVLLVRVPLLMSALVLVLGIFSKMQLFLVVLQPAQMVSTKQLLM